MAMVITRLLALQVSTDKSFVKFNDIYNDNVPSKYLQVNTNYIDLVCVAGGVTSKNSKYARTEFRQVTEDGGNASWDSDSTRSMYGQLSIMKLPKVKKAVMFSQIKLNKHGAPLMMFLNKKRVYMVCNTENFKKRENIDLNYELGDIITFKYTSSKDIITVYYKRNDNLPVIITYKVQFKNSYFKIGNYMQSASPPEDAFSTSIVRIYSVEIN